MRTSTAFTGANLLRRGLPVALAVGALGFLSATAQAADANTIDQVTVRAPRVKVVGHDYALDAPIEQVTVNARVQYDPVTLTTNSGVALLKDSVNDAARKACYRAGLLSDGAISPDNMTCIRNAIDAAQPQIEAAIDRARSESMSG